MPTVEDEASRDLAHAWMTAKDDLRQARQRLKSILLAHDVRYAGHADWGPAHPRWVSQYAFGSEWQQFAFEELRRTIEVRLAQCQRVEAALREAVTNWQFYPAVLGLQAMRGVQFTTAVGMLAELGDLSRFHHPRQLMAWLGLTHQNTRRVRSDAREASRRPAIAMQGSCSWKRPGAIGTLHV